MVSGTGAKSCCPRISHHARNKEFFVSMVPAAYDSCWYPSLARCTSSGELAISRARLSEGRGLVCSSAGSGCRGPPRLRRTSLSAPSSTGSPLPGFPMPTRPPMPGTAAPASTCAVSNSHGPNLAQRVLAPLLGAAVSLGLNLPTTRKFPFHRRQLTWPSA